MNRGRPEIEARKFLCSQECGEVKEIVRLPVEICLRPAKWWWDWQASIGGHVSTWGGLPRPSSGSDGLESRPAYLAIATAQA